ncbi:FKBP-type peptidyl-prolyl cis-trans isomerase [Parelusimicrobium proximum]|uniref:FKBP-type peptidyl-prolyl cis-trans isomerase n=1 Tax=Parelusimicrobium proximum TaxID=3228953 RepID=UPI003D174816
MKNLILLSLVVFLTSACSNTGADNYQNTGAPMNETEKYVEDFKKRPNVKELDGGILVETVTEGSGVTPISSDTVKVHYKGTLINGKEFDSSYKRGEPAEFPLNGVISCWTKGVAQMRKGGKATLVCPAPTAYGNRAVGPIPANSTLIFEIELLDIK